MKRYLLNIIIWLLDIGTNVIVFAGSPYETISSRIQKRVEHGDKWAIKASYMIGVIFRNPNHCIQSRIPDGIIKNGPNWWKSL
jgi:hypothetical protein